MMKSSRSNAARQSGVAQRDRLDRLVVPRRRAARRGPRRSRRRSRRGPARPGASPASSSTPVGPSPALAGVTRSGGDQPGLGFDRDVRFVAVAVFADDSCACGGSRDQRSRSPGPARRRRAIRHVPSVVAGFDVLAGDQRQAGRPRRLAPVERHVADRRCRASAQRVVDEPRRPAQSLAVGVVPRAHRFARRVVVMRARARTARGAGHHPPDPADRRRPAG